MRSLAGAGAAAVLLFGASVHATYSIAAGDPVAREVGGAGASCLGGFDVHVIYAAEPGRGVVHAQAYYEAELRDHALELLRGGLDPEGAVAAITEGDPDSAIRQYGIVDVLGHTAGFTGSSTTAFAADGQGSVAGIGYTVQGNILTSARVLEQAATAFEAPGCDLAERLMSALEAGARGGEGDQRCTPSGIPADSAFLQVEREGVAAGQYLALRVESSGESDPLPLLRDQYAAWRLGHPCPAPPVAEPDSAPPSRGESGSGCACRLRLERAVSTRRDRLGFLALGLLGAGWAYRRRRS